jgi:hypothetical protein
MNTTRTLRTWLGALALIAGTSATVRAADSTLSFSNSTNVVPANLVVTINGAPTPVPIAPMLSATDKRNQVMGRLALAGYTVAPVGANSLTISGLPAASTVKVETGATGEVNDGAAATHGAAGRIEFITPHFVPMSAQNQPAIFTAGIITDVGTLGVNVSAQDLNFQTDGPIICQALFQRLAPRAPQYGAQINYAGDRLEVYFDPAYTVTHGGVIFGTNSPTPGCGGSVVLPNPPPPPPPPCGSADFDCDGDLGTDADIEAFFACLAGLCPQLPCGSTADFDGDGDLGTDADIEAFFRVLGGSAC